MATYRILVIYPMIIASIISGFLIVNSLENNEFVENRDLQFVFLSIAVFVLIGGFFSAKKVILQILADTKFVIQNKTIEKQIPNGENIKISFREVKNYRYSKKEILLRTNRKKIAIPKNLDNFEELHSILKNNIQTGISYNLKFNINEYVLTNLTAISFLSLLVSFFLFTNPYYKLLMGFPLLIVLVYSIIFLSKNKDTPEEITKLIPKIILFSIVLLSYLIYIVVVYSNTLFQN